MAERGDVILRVENLTLSFAGLRALQEISFNVATGELFAIIGPNGAGKTSIFNCIGGVYRPQEGRILLEERNLIGMRRHEIAALGVARTFQNVELFPLLSVIDNLMLGRHHLMRTGILRGGLWVGPARRE